MADTLGIDLIWSNYIRDKNAGFDALYKMYYESLLSYCMGKLRHLDLAENAVADIFLKVLKFENINQIENPDGWIFTLAKNHCLSYWNKENRRAHILSEVLQPMKDFQSSQIEYKIDLASMEELIEQTLNPQDHQIWRLHVDGFPNGEIGEKMNMSAKTIANKKTMIRNAIHEVLKEKLGYQRNN